VTSSFQATDAEVFQPLTHEWVNAYNLKDAGRLAAFYDENASYISAHVPALVAHGRDEIQANFQKGMNAGGHIDGVRVLSSQVSCDLASLLCRYEATNNGQKVTGFNVIILKRVSGKWLILSHATVVRDPP
jgi:ketosteroid isomerase-like protein